MWSCMPTRPGMTVRPERSTTFAPSGIFVLARSPSEAIFPSRITSVWSARGAAPVPSMTRTRSEEHTSELQSRLHLVCRLLLEKKKSQHGAFPFPYHHSPDRLTLYSAMRESCGID